MTQKAQTYTSFSDKWNNNKSLFLKETLRENSDIFNWILTRNGFQNADELSTYLQSKKKILDAGCGNGRVTALLASYAPKNSEIVGVDLTAAHVAEENLSLYQNVSTYQKDLLDDLNDLGKFDFIYCQEVLHHTADPKKAFLNLCSQLSVDGEIAIYVYKKKAPMREHADDMIRSYISDLPYEEALQVAEEITQLGRVLTELNVKVDVPEVKALEIPAGEYDIQRLFYHFFLKCFFNSSLSHEENVVINYDWYHPVLCTRHTLEEILSWFHDAGLVIVQHHVDFYGITVRGRNLG